MSTLLQAAREEYSLRYFDWCLQQIRVAADNNFREVRAISGSQAALLTDFIEEFGRDEAEKVCVARLKKINQRVLELRGQQMRPDDIATAQRLTVFNRISESGLSVARIPKSIRARWDEICVQRPEPPPDIAEIRTVLENKLAKKLGTPSKSSGRGLLEFQHKIKEWIIFTTVESREDTIRYTHIVCGLPDIGPNTGIIETSISYLAWLGLPGTEWNYVMRSDLEPIGSQILRFTEIFLSAAPKLLSGISNPMRVS